MNTYEKKGYLLRDFRVFRLKDAHLAPILFHYHDFHKIILFLSGNAEYIIEGRSYPLAARDIIFVSAGEIHRPVLHAGAPYERIVIYVAPAFLARYTRGQDDLAACFTGHGRPRASCMRARGSATTSCSTWRSSSIQRTRRDLPTTSNNLNLCAHSHE